VSVMIAIVLLASWLGAATIVSASVAPAAFAVLPSRSLAGALVGRVLPVLFWSGLVVAIVTAWLAARYPGAGVRGTAAVVLAGACLVAQFAIAPRIERVRAAIGGPVDALDPSSPLRQAFGRLHGASVACLGVGGLAALFLLVLLVRVVSRSVP
jgi:hypothetical protein